MKRIVGSALLLLMVLLMSKSVVVGLEDLSLQTQAISSYGLDAKSVIQPGQPISQAGDTSADNPPIALVLVAAVMVSFTMATFIYGSRFIATRVAG